LATHNPSGAIDLVPITFAFVGDTIVTAVDHKPKRTTHLQRLENIRRNPHVTVLVDQYADDWNALWWVRIRGDA
jgi:PPOX class probable F420-dependent enzyme